MQDGTFSFVANELCLDLHNTSAWTPDYAPESERLPDFESLLDWCEAAGTIDPQTLEQFASSLDAGARADILRQTHELREVLHRVFSPVASNEIPSQANLEALNDFLASVLMRVEWAPGEEPAMAQGAVAGLSDLLAPVVWSAASLLVSPYRDRIKRCRNPECGWLYVDISRRGNRRWCDMKTCGNREKASRHYDRYKRQPDA